MSSNPLLFKAVHDALNKIIADWTQGNGGAPNLGKHGAQFSWNSAAELRASTAFGQPLIQPQIIGQKGLGKSANIVVDLTTGLTIAGGKKFPPMPYGGLDSNTGTYLTLTSPPILAIITWIEAGCPD